MDTADLLKRAWKAVQDSGVPEHLQEAALSEAVAHLRAGEGTRPTGTSPGKTPKKATKTPSRSERAEPEPDSRPAIDFDALLEALERESGVSAKELRQVFHVSKDNRIQVSPPTRQLGTSRAEQARTVVALVAGARYAALDEVPVDGDAVREECSRKKCYDVNNFSYKHVGNMKGFNLNEAGDILVNPKWVDEFDAAVATVTGRPEGSE